MGGHLFGAEPFLQSDLHKFDRLFDILDRSFNFEYYTTLGSGIRHPQHKRQNKTINDLDILISIYDLYKYFGNRFIYRCFQEHLQNCTNVVGTQTFEPLSFVSCGYNYEMGKIGQVDFFISDCPEFGINLYHCPKKSKYKGGHRNELLIAYIWALSYKKLSSDTWYRETVDFKHGYCGLVQSQKGSKVETIHRTTITKDWEEMCKLLDLASTGCTDSFESLFNQIKGAYYTARYPGLFEKTKEKAIGLFSKNKNLVFPNELMK